MASPVYVIFVAGGSGTRMGSSILKQFLPLCGRPVLIRTIERFVEAVPEAKVITVLPSQHFATWRDLCDRYELVCHQILVEGGITRFHSVKNALGKVPDNAIVAVHDGVRPLFSMDLVKAMLARMDECRALIPVIPVADTLRCKDGSEAPDRSRLVAVQTPQFFRSEDLRQAYNQAYDISFTDDASVVERYGVGISLHEGEKFNFKITTPEDLELAGFLV